MLRVMLVDDSQKEVSLLKEGLQAAGYDVVEVTTLTTSAPAFLDRVAAMRPDVIIIDTDSPTRDTLEQLSFVSAKQPRPIVLFTEDRDNAMIQAAIKAGVSAYVVAGMQPDRLRPILDVAVARFQQERELRDELRSLHERLAERKVIERAKGILMNQKGIAEDDAYRLMRDLAMDRNRKLVDVAQQIIDVTNLLG
jgi:response regulator NasT